jgi:hypothetical protein
MGEFAQRLAFAGGPTLWPLNGSVGLFRSPHSKTVEKLPIHGKSRIVLHEYPSMAQALTDTVATYSVAADRLQFFAATARDDWTAVFVSSFPHTEVLGGWLTRAQRDVQCDYLCYQWIPASPATVEPANRLLGGATFLEYRHARGRGEKRSIQTSNQGGRWDFDMVGEPRPYEQTEFYDRRRVADRLPLELIEAYLSACGIPVDQDDWLTGPVTVAVGRGNGLRRRDWKSMAELRSMVGYPADGIPMTLTNWSSDG